MMGELDSEMAGTLSVMPAALTSKCQGPKCTQNMYLTKEALTGESLYPENLVNP